jgi:hypothetical protein
MKDQTVKMAVFCVVAPSSQVSILRATMAAASISWNVGKLLPFYTALQPRRQPYSSSHTQSWEPQMRSPGWLPIISTFYVLNIRGSCALEYRNHGNSNQSPEEALLQSRTSCNRLVRSSGLPLLAHALTFRRPVETINKRKGIISSKGQPWKQEFIPVCQLDRSTQKHSKTGADTKNLCRFMGYPKEWRFASLLLCQC